MGNHSSDFECEVIAAALNEQGFLFQKRVAELIIEKNPDGKSHPHDWYREAIEYPITFAGENTRVDIVLRLRTSRERRQIYATIECKRSNPLYKYWVFFDPPQDGYAAYFFESRTLAEGPLIRKIPTVDPVFRFYLEARIDRGGKSFSATTAIEDAFQQVTLGTSGLFERLRGAGLKDFLIVPIVVTTAKIFSATFGGAGVDPETGIVKAEDVSREKKDWLAVNYSIGDERRHLHGADATGTNIQKDIETRFLRTVFVVQAKSINEFFGWLGRRDWD